jgi:hypothetical protein
LTFPAAFVKERAIVTRAASEGEATCYDHPAKQAVADCAECGRLVCQLCAVDFQGETWCPSCIAGAGARKNQALEGSRTLYDSLALMVAYWPLVLWPFTIFTAPVAVFLSIAYWRKPTGLLRRSKWRMAVALLLGLAQVAGWCWFFFFTYSLSRVGR